MAPHRSVDRERKGFASAVPGQESQAKPAKPLSREQVKAYLCGIETLVAKAGDRGRALVRSLVEHHGLSAQALDGQNIQIAMTLAPPGTVGEPLKVETVATVSSGSRIAFGSRNRTPRA